MIGQKSDQNWADHAEQRRRDRRDRKEPSEEERGREVLDDRRQQGVPSDAEAHWNRLAYEDFGGGPRDEVKREQEGIQRLIELEQLHQSQPGRGAGGERNGQ